MAIKLMSEDAKDIFMNHLNEGSSYEIVNPMVESGGEGICTAWHLVLHASCVVRETSVLFPHFHVILKFCFSSHKKIIPPEVSLVPI